MGNDVYISHAGKKGSKWGYSKGALIDVSKVAKGFVEDAKDAGGKLINQVKDTFSDQDKEIVSKTRQTVEQAKKTFDDTISAIKDNMPSEKKQNLKEMSLAGEKIKSSLKLAVRSYSDYASDKDIEKNPDKYSTFEKMSKQLSTELKKQTAFFDDKVADTKIKVNIFKKDTANKVKKAKDNLSNINWNPMQNNAIKERLYNIQEKAKRAKKKTDRAIGDVKDTLSKELSSILKKVKRR